MKTLSLCMIVRDEAELLPRFLAAAEGLYDELCVVDTGSTDETVALLEAAGAKVGHFAWNDDFAAARNESLKLATSTHILVLDADEMVSAAFVAEARQLIEQPSVGAATVSMVNTLPHGHRSRSSLMRLFVRHDDICFEHRIHEDVCVSVLKLLAKKNLQLAHLHADIEHLGYERHRAEERQKKDRDTRILWSLVGDDPFDLYSWFKLLEQGHFWQDNELVQEAAEGAQAALARHTSAPQEAQHFLGEMVVLLVMALRPYDEDAAAQLLHEWGERLSDSAALLLYRAQWREELGALELAQHDYEYCLALGPITTNLQLTSTRPLLGLARVALAQERQDDALDLIDRAVLTAPRDPEALLALASVGRMMGGSPAAQRLASAYQETYGESAEMNAAWGEAALMAGEGSEAESYLERATALSDHAPAYEALLARARDGHEAAPY